MPLSPTTLLFNITYLADHRYRKPNPTIGGIQDQRLALSLAILNLINFDSTIFKNFIVNLGRVLATYHSVFSKFDCVASAWLTLQQLLK